MPMSKPIQQKQHEQHRAWQRDHEAWRADVGRWRKELQAAQAELAEVRIMLQDSLDALETHADAVWENEQRIRAHELVLGAEVREGKRKTDKAWAAIHSRHALAHERLNEAHTRIKQHHRTVIAEIARLVNRARRAM
jgi:hypothetical protein